MNYHTKRAPVDGCPQPDTREIAPGSLVYVQQRPPRHCGEGTPHSLQFGKPDSEWVKFVEDAMERTP